ncbi:phosphatase PAP2 family protein [Aliiglaciecola litoralis]|uniref:undecaprenyl-diphosphate phosphatase n=1 Tax=Aliiglaciecola litoralis TaxID=582857 RepID=A0ABP3WUD8_9ALTE
MIIFGFVQLSSVVIAGSSAHIDEKILLMLRNEYDVSDPIGPMWVEEMMRDITAFGGVGILVAISLMVFSYLLLSGNHTLAWSFFVAITTGITVSFALKYGFTRPRPDLVPHGSYVYTSSFPSGHAMMSSLIYFTIAGMLAKVGFERRIKSYFFFVAVILTVAVGVSRVYLGVHWPTDVLAGWMTGTGWAMLSLFIVRYCRAKNWLQI